MQPWADRRNLFTHQRVDMPGPDEFDTRVGTDEDHQSDRRGLFPHDTGETRGDSAPLSRRIGPDRELPLHGGLGAGKSTLSGFLMPAAHRC